MKAVILAGGQGTRLAPYTQILPKPLMPIGDRPILEVLLRQMKRAGITEVILTVGYLAELLRAFFKDGSELGMKITYSREEKPLGTAGPLSLIQGLDSTFLVANGDVLTTLDLNALLQFHHEHKGIATIAVHQRQVKIDLGVIEWNGRHRISGYREKPILEYTVSMGIYVFEPRVLSYIPYNTYLDFPDLVLKMIEAGEVVNGYKFDGYWMDLGRPEDYAKASEDYLRMRHIFSSEG